MRLEEIYQICKIHQEALEAFIERQEAIERESDIFSTGRYKKSVDGELYIILADLKRLPFGQDDINRISNPMGISEREYLDICKRIYNKICGIIEMCEMLGYTQVDEEIGFAIKMPININFAELAQCINDFQIILSKCPFLKGKDATISLKRADVGSTWFEFIITGVEAAALLSVFAKMVDQGLILWSHIKTNKQQNELWRRAQIDNQLIKELADNHEKVLSALTNKFIEELSTEPLDNEDKARAELCFKKLTMWIDKGMEIHNAIECKEQIKPVFPTLEKWAELQSNTLKLLDQKDDEQK